MAKTWIVETQESWSITEPEVVACSDEEMKTLEPQMQAWREHWESLGYTPIIHRDPFSSAMSGLAKPTDAQRNAPKRIMHEGPPPQWALDAWPHWMVIVHDPASKRGRMSAPQRLGVTASPRIYYSWPCASTDDDSPAPWPKPPEGTALEDLAPTRFYGHRYTVANVNEVVKHRHDTIMQWQDSGEQFVVEGQWEKGFR